MSAEEDKSAAAAFARRLPELLALSEKELVEVNLDVEQAVQTILGGLPKVAAARAELVEHCPRLDFALVDALEDYAMCLHHAYGGYLIVTRPVVFRRELIAEGRSLRGILLSSLQALAKRGEVDPRRWKGRLRRGQGHMELANALHVLGQLHKHYLAHGNDRDGGPIESGLASVEEAKRALEISTDMLRAYGRRDLQPAIAEARLMLNRTFTMAVRSYEEAQRGMVFLYWHDDEDESHRLRSLWGHSRHRKKRRIAAETSAPETSSTGEGSAAQPHTDSIEAEPVRNARANGERANGERANGEKANGERANGERANGEKANGERAHSERANGERANSERAHGERANGERANGERADGAGEFGAGHTDEGHGDGEGAGNGKGPFVSN